MTVGGTIYNLSTVNGCGMANVADSLSAIQRAVYQEQKVTLPELAEILSNDVTLDKVLQDEIIARTEYAGI